MKLKEIKKAVENGKTVFCGNENYHVIKDNIGQWLILCPSNGYCIGLTWLDGTTLNDKETNFYTN